MVGVGLVGYGYWGPNLARNFAQSEGCRLAGICDTDENRRAKAARAYPQASAYSDFDTMLANDEIQLILVATPVYFHYDLAKKALLAGKDVFIEKPITQYSHQAEELIRIADERQRIIFVDHTFLFTGAVQKIKQIVDSKELGDLLYFDSTRINLGLFQQDVNVIYDLAPHDLSILCHLVDQDPVSVQAMGACHAGNGIENLAYLHLEFANGLVAHFHLSWLAPVKIRKTIIGGTHKMIVWDDLDNSEKVKLYDKGIVVHAADEEAVNKIRVDYRTGDMCAPKLNHREALAAEAEHVINCVINRIQPLADGREGLRVSRILEASTRSLANCCKRIEIGQD